MNISFDVIGNVQAVMFRKTFCHGAKKRGIIAGATNDRGNRQRVLCSLKGERNQIEKFMNELASLEKLNSWGAKVNEIEIKDEFTPIERHEITTLSLDEKNLSKDIEFFL